MELHHFSRTERNKKEKKNNQKSANGKYEKIIWNENKARRIGRTIISLDFRWDETVLTFLEQNRFVALRKCVSIKHAFDFVFDVHYSVCVNQVTHVFRP